MSFFFSIRLLITLSLAFFKLEAKTDSDSEAFVHLHSSVELVTDENFTSFFESSDIKLIEYLVPTCGYSKGLAPVIKDLSKIIDKKKASMKIAQVDCTKSKNLCERYGVQSYPSLHIHKDHVDLYKHYLGDRSSESIYEAMKAVAENAVVNISTINEFTKLISQQKPVVMLAVIDDAHKDMMKSLSHVFEYPTFALFQNEEVRDEALKHISSPNLLSTSNLFVLHKGYSSTPDIFKGTFKEKRLFKFLNKAILPRFSDVDGQTYLLYYLSGLPLGYLAYKTKSERDMLADKIADMSIRYREKIAFLGLNITGNDAYASVLGMSSSQTPFFTIYQSEKDLKFGMNQTLHPNGPSIESIELFVKDFLADNLVRTMRSEAIPTEEEQKKLDVYKIVGKSFASAVSDVNKDILVSVYAPWCGICSTLKPTYKKLSMIFKHELNSKNVIISDFNYYENEAEFGHKVMGVPTILLYKAHDKVNSTTLIRNPILYSGDRSLKSLVNFIKTESYYKLDGTGYISKYANMTVKTDESNFNLPIEMNDSSGDSNPSKEADSNGHDEL